MPPVEPLGPSQPAAWLPDFVGGGVDHALHQLGPAQVLVRSVRTPSRRTLDRWSWPDLRPLDRTVFHFDAEHVSEAERYTTRGGPNLHPAPIRLPIRMELGVTITPLPGAVATLVHAGTVRFRGEEVEAIGLAVGQRGEERVLWSARGIGELCLEGHWELIAWLGRRPRFAPLQVPPELPDLGDSARGGRPDGVF